MYLQCLFVFVLAHQSSCMQLSVSPNGRDVYQNARNANPNAVVKSIQNLGVTLSLQESLENNGNIVLSPLSIGSLLGVLLLASRRDTHQELTNAMRLQDLTDEEIHSFYQRILGSLESRNSEVLLEIASRLYVQFGYSINDRYLQIAETMYNISVGGVDFASSGSKARHEINKWVSDRTHDKIKELFNRDFTPDTRFVAVNAVYFNGEWKNQFNSGLTDPNGVFRTGSGEDIRIPFMRNIISVKHISDKEMPRSRSCNVGSFEMIALPYKGEQFSMYIISPGGDPSANKLALIERSLINSDCLDSILRRMKLERVSVQIPRMKISSKMSLKKSLQRLNVRSLFSSSKVDLGRLSSTPGLFVDDIVHEAVIELTEIGTKAAAATGTTYDRIGGNIRFTMDKPSILFIRDEINGIMLFWAKVIEPSLVQ